MLLEDRNLEDRQEPRRVLIADSSPLMRQWLASTLAHAMPIPPEFERVDDGLDLLYHLAERGRFDLVVAPAALPGLDAAQVLAMARTAGLYTPFLLTCSVSDAGMRSLVARCRPAELVDDPLDATAIVAAARRLLAAALPAGGKVAWERALPAARAREMLRRQQNS